MTGGRIASSAACSPRDIAKKFIQSAVHKKKSFDGLWAYLVTTWAQVVGRSGRPGPGPSSPRPDLDPVTHPSGTSAPAYVDPRRAGPRASGAGFARALGTRIRPVVPPTSNTWKTGADAAEREAGGCGPRPPRTGPKGGRRRRPSPSNKTAKPADRGGRKQGAVGSRSVEKNTSENRWVENEKRVRPSPPPRPFSLSPIVTVDRAKAGAGAGGIAPPAVGRGAARRGGEEGGGQVGGPVGCNGPAKM